MRAMQTVTAELASSPIAQSNSTRAADRFGEAKAPTSRSTRSQLAPQAVLEKRKLRQVGALQISALRAWGARGCAWLFYQRNKKAEQGRPTRLLVSAMKLQHPLQPLARRSQFCERIVFFE